MLRINICDDREEHLQTINAAAENYLQKRNMDAHICLFTNAMDYLDHISGKGGSEIALLDICMPGINGMDIAKEIRKRADQTEIIFLTTSSEYAVDAFHLKAAHYLVKPFTQIQFEEAMDRAMEHFSQEERAIAVKSEGGEMYSLKLDEIQYIESFSHDQNVYLQTGEILKLHLSLSGIFDEISTISPNQFIMPYKGYVVNLKSIMRIESRRIILRSGVEIPLPRGAFREVKARFFDYMFNQNI